MLFAKGFFMKVRKLISMELLSLFGLMTFVVSYAFADDAVVAPQDFFTQVLDAYQSFGGLTTLLKISSIILLIVTSMKVSVLNDLIWSHLGAAKVYVAPVLGLVGGLLGIGTGGTAITAASVFAYMSAGAGAVFLHELLDSIKGIPGLGEAYVAIINVIERTVGGPAAHGRPSMTPRQYRAMRLERGERV